MARLFRLLGFCFGLVWLAFSTASAGLPRPLVVTNDHAAAPYSYLDQDAQPQGVLIELWQQLGQQQGLEIEFLLLPWEYSLEALQQGQAHVHTGLIQNDERSQYLTFSQPLFSIRGTLFVRKEHLGCCLDSLMALEYGVVNQTFEQSFVRQHFSSWLEVAFADAQDLYQALALEAVHIFVADEQTAMNQLQQLGLEDQFEPYLLLYQQPLRAAVLQQNQAWMVDLESMISANGDHTRLLDPYADYLSRKADWLWLLLLAVLLFLMIMLYWRKNQILKLKLLLSRESDRLEKQDRLFKTVTDLSPVGIFVASKNRILLSNPALLQLLGYQQEQLLQLSWWELIHPEDQYAFNMALSAAAEVQSLSLRMFESSGAVRWVDLAFRSYSNEQSWLTGTIKDAQQQKQQELDLQYQSGLNRLLADVGSLLVGVEQENYDHAIHQLLAMLGRFFHADRSYLFMIRGHEQTLQNTHEWTASGVKPAIHEVAPVTAEQMPWFMNKLQQAMNRQSIFALEDLHQDPQFLAAPRDEQAVFFDQGIRAMVIMPLVQDQELIGFIGFDSLRVRTWPSQLAQVFQESAQQLASVIASLAKEHRLMLAMQTDALTGLFNRYYLKQHLPNLWAEAQQGSQSLAFVMLDLDHFKQINDQHGHLLGDQVLRQVGSMIAGHLRQQDLAVRYGGEEFLLILLAVDLDISRKVIQRLLDAIAGQRFQLEDAQELQVQASAGIAGSLEAEEISDPWYWIDLADQRLYQAKQQGRNRVITA